LRRPSAESDTANLTKLSIESSGLSRTELFHAQLVARFSAVASVPFHKCLICHLPVSCAAREAATVSAASVFMCVCCVGVCVCFQFVCLTVYSFISPNRGSKKHRHIPGMGTRRKSSRPRRDRDETFVALET